MTLFTGERIILTAARLPEDAETMARWTRDTELARLLANGSARPLTAPEVRDQYEEFKDGLPGDFFLFLVRERSGPRAGRLLGSVGLEEVEGRQRQRLNRGGRRWDLIFMGVQRDAGG